MADGEVDFNVQLAVPRGPIDLDDVRTPAQFAQWLNHTVGATGCLVAFVAVPWVVRDALLLHAERMQPGGATLYSHGPLRIQGVTIYEQ